MQQQNTHTIHALELGPMENFVYLIHDHATDRAAVVDPAWEVSKVIELANAKGIKISDILLTHSHQDHINGVDEVLNHSDAQIHLLKQEADFWGKSLSKSALHAGGDEILLGETRIEVLHTPGHTPGSTCYRINDDLITGDTLFVFGCGRCDLQGGDPEEMFNTLKNMRENLPSQTRIHPGHNYAEKTTSNLQEQIEGNPFLHFSDMKQFVHYRMHEHDRIRDTPYQAVKKS